MEELLIICTTKTPFITPDEILYEQTNGVSMGTPLGPTFANFYMCHIENKIFYTCPSMKPTTYCRYVNDIFVIAENFSKIMRLKEIFEKNSVLKFTYIN